MAQRKRRNMKSKSVRQNTSNEKFQRSGTNDRDGWRGSNRTDDSGSNLFSWYNRNPLLLNTVARLPFPYKPGMRLPALIYRGATDVHTDTYTIPGVMKFSFTPTIGISKSVVDPASLAAKELYGRIRATFSGTLPEDAPDIMLYVLALDSISMLIAHMKRIYRIISTYSPMNYAIPNDLLKAICGMNVNIPRLEQSKMQLLNNVNQLVGMTKKFFIPGDLDIFNRHEWMCDNVYFDANTANAQMYVFVPDGYFIMGTDSEGIGCLDFTGLNQDGATSIVDSLFTATRNAIEMLANSEDAYTISGHLSKAYEGRPQFVIDYLRQDEPFTPYYNEMVLSQIENIKIVPTKFGNDHAISQDPKTNAVVSIPKFDNSGITQVAAPNQAIINIRSDSPSVEEIVEASRLGAIADANTGEVVCGTEVVTGLTMIGGDYASLGIEGCSVINLTDPSDAMLFINQISTYSKWDWAPLLPICFQYLATGSTTVNYQGVLIGDIHNITYCTTDQMKEINKVCLYSEFNSFDLI